MLFLNVQYATFNLDYIVIVKYFGNIIQQPFPVQARSVSAYIHYGAFFLRLVILDDRVSAAYFRIVGNHIVAAFVTADHKIRGVHRDLLAADPAVVDEDQTRFKAVIRMKTDLPLLNSRLLLFFAFAKLQFVKQLRLFQFDDAYCQHKHDQKSETGRRADEEKQQKQNKNNHTNQNKIHSGLLRRNVVFHISTSQGRHVDFMLADPDSVMIPNNALTVMISLTVHAGSVRGIIAQEHIVSPEIKLAMRS